MTVTVTGGMTWAMPVPCANSTSSTAQIGVASSKPVNAAMQAATSSSPAVHTARAPNRRTTSRDRGANTSCVTASGSSSRPVSSG